MWGAPSSSVREGCQTVTRTPKMSCWDSLGRGAGDDGLEMGCRDKRLW